MISHPNYMLTAILLLIPILGIGQNPTLNPNSKGRKLEQLGQTLRDPSSLRNADGSPGIDYWQQQVDYEIECELDVENLRLNGQEKITYHNQSPNTLHYLWLQLDENQHDSTSDYLRSYPSSITEVMSESRFRFIDLVEEEGKIYGHKILEITDQNGQPLEFRINKTMMRVNLPEALKSGKKVTFNIKWYYNIVNRESLLIAPRGGYEFFSDNKSYLFTMTQWYPRLCVYSEFEGWQNKQYAAQGEFALTFGNFVVKITVPENHTVAATGECLNYKEVLTKNQLERWNEAKNASQPMKIITLEEAKQNEKSKKSGKTKTWVFRADNVRDFAWGSSEKFIWDAMPHFTEDGKSVMCMSFYGKEAFPLYNMYSTKTIIKTLENYSKYTFPYPYPVAISVEAKNGMEYPMISFNEGRGSADDEGNKYNMISTIIHEIGHNYFPMIVNSDERQWAWMDEGIDSFLQYLTQIEVDTIYKTNNSFIRYFYNYARLSKPIMTNADNLSLDNYSLISYTKTAIGLNILRNTIIGKESFDFAFKTYAKRWAFKHPTPTDFFRTMEDASGVDLDWFWNGWFYSTDLVDISLDSTKWYKLDLENATKVEQLKNANPEIDSQTSQYSKENYYELSISNKGGLVMPVIIQWVFIDGTKEIDWIPVTIWRLNEDNFTKVYIKNKEVKKIIIDPDNETIDINLSNNQWPKRDEKPPSRFETFKLKKRK